VAARSEPDGAGLERFLEAASSYQAAHQGCLSRLWNLGAQGAPVQQIRRAVARLLVDAKRHGRVREELTSTDITLLLWSIRGVIETTRHVAPDAWRRHLDLLIAGLRPASGQLGHPPMTRAEVDAVVARS
jgi:hypothetical protein